VCYISSGALNLYDVVLEYLDTHGLPRGGVLLNDWGSRVRRFRTVLHEHKSTRVAHLLVRSPTLPLLLIGDDTQEDPELYAQAARAHPGRVAAIWIRTVRRDAGRHAEVEALRREISDTGTEFVYAAETEMFVEHARRRGWIGSAG
jgi:phosphatidate phosphatase APP1